MKTNVSETSLEAETPSRVNIQPPIEKCCELIAQVKLEASDSACYFDQQGEIDREEMIG